MSREENPSALFPYQVIHVPNEHGAVGKEVEKSSTVSIDDFALCLLRVTRKMSSVLLEFDVGKN
jgi:hypothetical protein